VQHSDRFGKIAVTMLMWAFPILIFVVVYVYIVHNKTPNDANTLDNNKITTESATPTPVPTQSASPTPTPTPTPPPVTLTWTETKKTIRYYTVSAGVHRVQIDITGHCWLEVRKDSNTGEKLISKNVDGTQTFSYDLTQPLYVSIGRADYAVLTVDGQTVDDGDKADAVKFTFTPEAAAAR
jgi:cytoskeletal protein RodZ